MDLELTETDLSMEEYHSSCVAKWEGLVKLFVWTINVEVSDSDDDASA